MIRVVRMVGVVRTVRTVRMIRMVGVVWLVFRHDGLLKRSSYEYEIAYLRLSITYHREMADLGTGGVRRLATLG
jgi:hypothetical protein